MRAAVAFTYAGNTRFAYSAIQKLQKSLESVQPKDTLAEIERVLDREYRRNVLKHPDHATDPALPYQLLLAVWSPGDGAKFFMTEQTAVVAGRDYECIGIGDYLGHYLIGRSGTSGLAVREALALSAYALAGIKDYVRECGGMSV